MKLQNKIKISINLILTMGLLFPSVGFANGPVNANLKTLDKLRERFEFSYCLKTSPVDKAIEKHTNKIVDKAVKVKTLLVAQKLFDASNEKWVKNKRLTPDQIKDKVGKAEGSQVIEGGVSDLIIYIDANGLELKGKAPELNEKLRKLKAKVSELKLNEEELLYLSSEEFKNALSKKVKDLKNGSKEVANAEAGSKKTESENLQEEVKPLSPKFEELAVFIASNELSLYVDSLEFLHRNKLKSDLKTLALLSKESDVEVTKRSFNELFIISASAKVSHVQASSLYVDSKKIFLDTITVKNITVFGNETHLKSVQSENINIDTINGSLDDVTVTGVLNFSGQGKATFNNVKAETLNYRNSGARSATEFIGSEMGVLNYHNSGTFGMTHLKKTTGKTFLIDADGTFSVVDLENVSGELFYITNSGTGSATSLKDVTGKIFGIDSDGTMGPLSMENVSGDFLVAENTGTNPEIEGKNLNFPNGGIYLGSGIRLNNVDIVLEKVTAKTISLCRAVREHWRKVYNERYYKHHMLGEPKEYDYSFGLIDAKELKSDVLVLLDYIPTKITGETKILIAPKGLKIDGNLKYETRIDFVPEM